MRGMGWPGGKGGLTESAVVSARGYKTVAALPLRNLKDSEGNQYLCYTPLQGMESSVPRQDACSLLDGWLADQY